MRVSQPRATPFLSSCLVTELPSTFPDRIRASYVGAAAAGAPQAPAIAISTTYNAADRIVEIRFAKPLAPYRTVKVELLDGIKGTEDVNRCGDVRFVECKA